MRVLLLADSLKPGGKERRLVELIKGLRTYEDIDLHLVVFSDKIHYNEVFGLGVPVIILNRIPKRNPVVFYRLFKLCKRWKPDLIHSWGTMSTIIALPASLLLKIKIINGNIANAPKDLNFFDARLFRAKFTFPFSTIVTGNSFAGLKAYSVPKKKAVCIYNGFDTNRVSNLVDERIIRDKFNISSKNVIGMVASFTKRKDFKTFIRSGLILLSHRNDVSFVAVGNGPNLEVCKALIPLEYSKFFIFTGLQKDVESIINVFDIGVLSTNTKMHGEGISNSILEYMAMGKPTVATSGGGTNEVVIDGETGFLVPSFSPEVMADKINYLLENPLMFQEMGNASRRRLNQTFSLEKMTNSFYDLYLKFGKSAS